MHRRRRLPLFVILLLASAVPLTGVRAEDTPLRILVRADDAKFIGTGVGGLYATVRDADTGELLGGGAVAGGTGDTAALMSEPRPRGATAVSDDAASLALTLDLEQPRRIEVSVTGPQAVAQGRQRVTTTTWLLPGQDRSTYPLVLHLNGLLVDLVGYDSTRAGLSIEADVSMLCGCTITDDGPWRAGDYRVEALLYREGEILHRAPLAFTGETGRFAGTLPPAKGEARVLEIRALQVSTGNAGVFREDIVN
ncbi:hypothetical protein [Pseudohaliea rubra]|uniref:Uncharacterized protein n=1 Tax=Pseudohaliea rubra DSM 19751 TaxID=1265313 RepID=A0A095XVB8_9GAMM|nr:hypothetical protein [Pseudohaliea rubra]KGE03596.1 hypothetical protein HRUBRA_01975 [Pseudohaliea rubra DSM 19751]